MLAKPKLPFLLFNGPKQLDIDFYSGYDERFLSRKSKILKSVLANPDLMLEFISEDDGPDEPERMRHALAAEILFTEFHQFESFFAMLVSPFQNLPHWIFLNTYSTGAIKDKARQFIAGDFRTLSGGIAPDRDGFLKHAIYENLVAEDGKEASWQNTFENLWWIIYRMAEKYLAAEEYNSYKHGLRMMSAASKLAISLNPNDFSNAFVTSSPHSITHLKFNKVTEGTNVSIDTKAFNPEESFQHILIMAEILTNIKRIRLATLLGKPGVEVSLFPGIDKQGLQQLVITNNWSFSA